MTKLVHAAFGAALWTAGVAACGAPHAQPSPGPIATTVGPSVPGAATSTSSPATTALSGQVLVRHGESYRAATVVDHLADGRIRVRYGHREDTEDVVATRLRQAVFSVGKLWTGHQVVVAVDGGPQAPATVLGFFDETRGLVRFGPGGSWDGSQGTPVDRVVPVGRISPAPAPPLAPWELPRADGTMSPIMQEPRPDLPKQGDPIWVWHGGAYLPAERDFQDGHGVVVRYGNGELETINPCYLIHVPPKTPGKTTFAAGDAVYIEWNHIFFDGTVRGPGGTAGHYRVHFDRTADGDEATVPVARLRPRTPL